MLVMQKIDKESLSDVVSDSNKKTGPCIRMIIVAKSKKSADSAVSIVAPDKTPSLAEKFISNSRFPTSGSKQTRQGLMIPMFRRIFEESIEDVNVRAKVCPMSVWVRALEVAFGPMELENSSSEEIEKREMKKRSILLDCLYAQQKRKDKRELKALFSKKIGTEKKSIFLDYLYDKPKWAKMLRNDRIRRKRNWKHFCVLAAEKV